VSRITTDGKSDGGTTRLDDLELRCHLHHYDEHEGQWKPERARKRRARA
jgi:hypothetical protein